MSGNALQLSQELRLAQHGGALYSQHLLSHFPPSLSALSSQWNLWNQGHHHRDGFEAERLFSVVPGVPLRQDFGMSRCGPCQPRWMVWAGRWAIYPVLPNLPCFLCRFSHLSRSRRRCTKPRANKTMVLSLESRFDLHSRFRSAHCCVYLFFQLTGQTGVVQSTTCVWGVRLVSRAGMRWGWAHLQNGICAVLGCCTRWKHSLQQTAGGQSCGSLCLQSIVHGEAPAHSRSVQQIITK